MLKYIGKYIPLLPKLQEGIHIFPGSPGQPADMAEAHRRQPEGSLRSALCKPKRRGTGRKAAAAAALLRRKIHRNGRSPGRTAHRRHRSDGNLHRPVPGRGTPVPGAGTGAGHDLPGGTAQGRRPGSGLMKQSCKNYRLNRTSSVH